MSKADGLSIVIRFDEAITTNLDSFNMNSIKMEGNIWNHVPGGELLNYTWVFETVDFYNGSDTELIFSTNVYDRFESCVGELTVMYDSTIGSLGGIGGPTESFNISFNPEDLIPKPDVANLENISIDNINVDDDLIRIYYKDTNNTENISITNITIIDALTHIDDL